jgi:[protein-PII] uridylyltransferase
MLQRYHKKGDPGLRVTRARAVMMDVLMENLFLDAQKIWSDENGPPPCPAAIIATGGYGRSELNPFSDIDLMFLFPNRVKQERVTPFQTVLTEEILYILWDLRLKVGHSVRNTREAIAEASNEIKSKNAFLDSRCIAGDAKLFKRFEKDYRRWVLRDEPEEYVRARLDAIAKRHAKYGNTPFLQEPEIKNGVGGLRDYHNILWLAEIKLDSHDTSALVDRHYLKPEEEKTLLASYDFLLRVRNQLHFQSKRPTDVLNLENQPLLAFRLGYRQRNILRRVEHFMQDYYASANSIYRISERVLRRMRMNLLPGREKITFKSVIESRRGGTEKELDGLILRDGRFYFLA